MDDPEPSFTADINRRAASRMILCGGGIIAASGAIAKSLVADVRREMAGR